MRLKKKEIGHRLLHHEDLGEVPESQLNSNRLYGLSFGGEHDVREVVDPCYCSSKTEHQRMQAKQCSKVMPVECSRRLWQDNVLSNSSDPNSMGGATDFG